VSDSVKSPKVYRRPTKKSNVLWLHYSHLYGIPATGYGFFTVYGPSADRYGVFFLFKQALTAAKPLWSSTTRHDRDFTMLTDRKGLYEHVTKPPEKDENGDGIKFTISNQHARKLLRFYRYTEKETNTPKRIFSRCSGRRLSDLCRLTDLMRALISPLTPRNLV
jgi:UDP-glucuronate 4-epimerase